MDAWEWSHTKRIKLCSTPGHIHFLTFSTYQRLLLLSNDAWRHMLAEQLERACKNHDVALWAYVFMPDHVHLLVKLCLAGRRRS